MRVGDETVRVITQSRFVKRKHGGSATRRAVVLNKMYLNGLLNISSHVCPCSRPRWMSERVCWQLGNLWRAHMAHRVNDHPSRLPVAQATVLALPPPSQAEVSVSPGLDRFLLLQDEWVEVALVMARWWELGCGLFIKDWLGQMGYGSDNSAFKEHYVVFRGRHFREEEEDL